ncbi:MAG: hypothetical protein ACJ749_06535 [Flavisolibacter sp.]
MKRIFILCLAVLTIFTACKNRTSETVASENDIDAARNFIQAALDGRWEDANKYMLQDSINVQLLETSEQSYRSKSSEDKRGYRESSINLFGSRKIGDSITIVNYSNSFRNKKDSLKVLRIGGQWLIDLKYSLLATDSTKHGQ